MKKVIIVFAAATILLFAFHIVKATEKQKEMDNASMLQFHYMYNAVRP